MTMWTQMGQLFWGARFPGHPPGQMQSSGDPKCFSPFTKMDMGDPTTHFGHPMVNKPAPSIPAAKAMTSKNDPPRSAHSGSLNYHSNHHNVHHSSHYSSHTMYPLTGHHSVHSSSKHKPDIGGLLSSNYNSPNLAHQAGSGSLSSSTTNPYSHLSSCEGPPPLLPNLQPPPPRPPPSSNNSPTKQQNQERLKKCKAVFGQNQRELWCNKCRWKKKCVRFPEVDSESRNDRQDSSEKAMAKKISDPPTQVPPQHFKYQNSSHDLPPIPHQQQQAWYNSVVQSITGGTTGLPTDLLQQQQQNQSRYRNAGSSSENSCPSPSLNSQFHRYSSSGQQSGPQLPPVPGGVQPQLFGQVPPAVSGFNASKLAKSPVNPMKLTSHFHNKKGPSFNSSSEGQFLKENPDGSNTSGLPAPTAPSTSSANSTNRKCRALYGFEQKNKWCKPCRNKKRCIQFM